MSFDGMVAQEPGIEGRIGVTWAIKAVNGRRAKRTITTGTVGFSCGNIKSPKIKPYPYMSS
jgi:hypothetical protein